MVLPHGYIPMVRSQFFFFLDAPLIMRLFFPKSSQEDYPPLGRSAGFMFKNNGPLSCKFIFQWSNNTKDDL